MLSFMYFNNHLAENLEPHVIKEKTRPTLIQKFMKEQPKLFASREIEKFIKYQTMDPAELSTDLGYRNPIHDMLD